MVSSVFVAVCVVVALASHQTSAQWWGTQPQGLVGGWGQSASTALGFGNTLQQQDPTRYLTCIDTNMNDEMRVTLSLGRDGGTNNNPWGGMMANRFANRLSLRLSARITSGAGSSLQGQFRLVVTESSRTEEGCSRQALGDILTDRSWWAQPRTARGIIGTPVFVMQGQTATSSESIENLRFEELPGRGMALCPANQISGTTCMDPILCCKIGYDSQPATMPFAPQGQLFPQGVQGFGNNNGMNMGAGQGLNQGPPGLSLGFGQSNAPSNNAGSPNLPGLPF